MALQPVFFNKKTVKHIDASSWRLHARAMSTMVKTMMEAASPREKDIAYADCVRESVDIHIGD